MTAQSTLSRIPQNLFHVITSLMLMTALCQAEPPHVAESAPQTFAPDTSSSAPRQLTVTGDEAILSVVEEFHPEVGIGPPAPLIVQTALKPEASFNLDPGSRTGNSRVRPLSGEDNGSGLRRQWGQPNLQSVPPQTAPVQSPGQAPATPENFKSDRIAARSRDPRMIGFLQQASFNQIVNLFSETSRMIDTRHVNPAPYEQRTVDALNGLSQAIASPEFLQVNRISPNQQAIQSLQQELMQLAHSQPARNLSEAIGLMQWSAELASQRIGLRREAAALEYLNGTLDSLDRYSAFIPAKTQTGPSASLEERIVGIGVELKVDERGAMIMGVIENGPAANAGLKKGDLIVAINGRNIGGMPLAQSAEMISGPQGTSVTLQIDRQGQSSRVQVPRRQIYISSVTDAKFLDSKRTVGYLRVKQFSESTAEDLTKEMTKLHNAGMDSLVMDLRGNPGGLLTECVDVCDIFLPGGTIVSTKGRTQGDNASFQAKRPQTWSIPLVVLIDDHSASASEIFAAAVQENGRGVVVGRRSYGKGTVQTHFPLQTVSGELKLTTALFYSPAGREMAGQGVTPDVPVQKDPGANEEDERQDADLLTALRVVQSGRPSQLAREAGQEKRHLGGNFGR